MFKKSPYLLMLAVFALLALGIIMLFSTGAFAADANKDVYYFVKRQAIMLTLGLLAGGIAIFVPVSFYERWKWPILLGALVLLVGCYLPVIGVERNGASRWVRLGIQFQPSEIAKLALLIYLAAHYSRSPVEIATLRKGFLEPLAVVGLVAGLILFQMDVGTAALVVLMSCLVMFIAGAPVFYLASMSVIAAQIFAIFIMNNPERMARVFAYLYPEVYVDDSYQQIQGLHAFARGGWEGLGLGNGTQKFGNLPFAHTDFILPIIGEELGLPATLFIVTLFLVIIILGLIISSHARTRFGQVLGYGIVMMLATQAAINIGVTTMLLPNKGLPLPFISYGGSNLVLCLICIGILLRLYREGIDLKPNPDRKLLEARPIMGL